MAKVRKVSARMLKNQRFNLTLSLKKVRTKYALFLTFSPSFFIRGAYFATLGLL